MSHLPEAIAVLYVLNSLVSVIPFGDKVGVGVEAAIALCQTVQTMRSNQEAYAELGRKASSLLASVANTLQKADATRMPSISANLDSLIWVIGQVQKSVDARRITSTEKKSKFFNPVRRLIETKEEKEAIQGLVQKINDAVVDFQVSSNIRLELYDQDILQAVRRLELSAKTQAEDANNVLLKELAPVEDAAHYAAKLKIARCLEETRVALLTDLDSWLIESDGPQFFWLNGLAGTGKSTVARSFCERTAKLEKVYLASFFISRLAAADRRDAISIFHTLVYQFAVGNAAMRRTVCDALRADPSILKKGLGLQISKLFSPLLLLIPSSTRVVIVIDALDECDKDDDGREAGELIPLLMSCLRSASQHRFLITSRDEVSIRKMFKEVTGGASEQRALRLHDIDKSVVESDIRLYFRHHLRRIASRDMDLDADEWPGVSAFTELLARTGVLFVYAATVVRFLDEPKVDPRIRLQRVLDGDRDSAAKTYRMLDFLYTNVLNTAASSTDHIGNLEDDLVQQVRSLVGTIVCLQQTLPSNDIVALMGLNKYDTRQSLAQLSAVLTCEDDEPVRIFHPSFPDFLVDSSRCLDGRFRLIPAERHSEIAFRCLVLMNMRLRYDICGSGRPWLENDKVVHLVDALKDLGALRYACMYWAAHLRLAGAQDSRLAGELLSFCEEHLLHWIELLSLVGKLSFVDDYLPGALEWCESDRVNTIKKVRPLLSDVRRLLRCYRIPIESYALHVYHSALVTMPQCPLLIDSVSPSLILPKLISPRQASWGDDVQVLEGHILSVGSVAFSSDGRQVVSGSDDQTVRIWDAQTGTELRVLQGHDGWVCSVAFSPDDEQVVSGSADKTVRIWDAQTGAELRLLQGHGSWVRSVAFSPDGKQVISGCDDKSVRIWDAQKGAELRLLQGHDKCVRSVAFSPDGKRVVSGSNDNTVRIWDPQTGAELCLLRGHDKWVYSVAFSSDGKQVVSGANDNTIRIWDSQAGAEFRLLQGHNDYVRSVAFSPDSKQVVSGSADKTVRVWDVQAGAELRVLQGHNGWVCSAVFSPNGEQIVSCSVDKTIRIWGAQTGGGLRMVRGHNDYVRSVAFSPDGKQVVSGSNDKTVRIWDTQTGAELCLLQGHNNWVYTVVFSPDGKQVVSSSNDKTVRIWDAQTGAELHLLQGHNGWVHTVAFSPDGKQIVSGSNDKDVRVWDAQTGAELRVFLGHLSRVRSVAFSPDGKQVVSGSDDKTVRIWNSQTGAGLRVLQGHTDCVRSAAFSPDGKQVVSGSNDKTVRIWDAQNGDELRVLQYHDRPVVYVAFSRDGTQVLSRDYRGNDRPWDMATTDPENVYHPGTSQTSLNSSVSGHLRLYLDAETGWVAARSSLDDHALRVCWLPKERRGTASTTLQHTLIVGAESGAVSILSFAKVVDAMQAADIFNIV